MINGKPLIAGIQQIGIGNANVHDTWRWYRQHFNFDVPIFDEKAEAALMLPYTGGEPRERHAILALNMRGGGGLEIWQYTCRTPQAPDFQPLLGDLGIYILKIKSSDVPATFSFLKSKNVNLLGEVNQNPAGQAHFYLSDPFGNLVEVVEGNDWFSNSSGSMGGVYGCTVGVSDMARSIEFYKNMLGYDVVVFDEKKPFDDLKILPGGEQVFQRALLRHSEPRRGPFSRLFGSNEIELLQVHGRRPRKIFENRFWGDLGYIHICFDVVGMDAMREKCKLLGHPFTVDSGNFDMGEAAGHFSYIEDPDGTLIEFVEAHKVPLIKKIGWYLNLKKRPHGKSLPNWMIKALGFGRVRD
ncbi:MAG TPA: VOC family protein [Bacteroidetes bacterium]|nr:VOC family protein [Bacteroidota bacterium]